MASNPQILDRRSFKAGKVIFQQGEPGDAAYVVESGEVGIYKTIKGENVKLGTVAPGGIFGEMAVIDGSERMASAVAENHVVVVRVPKGIFDQKMNACDPFIRGLINIFLVNIRSAYKSFSKKPRSFADYIEMLEAYSADLQSYLSSGNLAEHSQDVTEATVELDAAIQKVKAAAAGHKDRRRSVIDASDPDGLTLRAVLEKG